MKPNALRCLVLDHDDTVVRSTPDIHYPSFVETLALLRPHLPAPTLEEYIRDNNELGFAEMCDRLGFTPEEVALEGEMWRKWTDRTVPHTFPGMKELLTDFRRAGGLICVVSHSEQDIIRRDYQARFSMEPDVIFGWEVPRNLRKPHPHALDRIMAMYGLTPQEMLMVDDMRLGLDMARARGVEFAWAGWSDTACVVRPQMEAQADHVLYRVEDMRSLIWPE